MPEAASIPGVSVVIPAYNYGHFVGRAIQSVLDQDHPRVEIIVVDDGSKDNTREVVAAFGDRVRYLYQENSGLPASRNTGIRAAQFELIGFLDADDLWLPGMLSQAVAAFRELPKEFGLVACQSSLIDPKGELIQVRPTRPELAGEILASDILLATRFSPSAVVVKKEALEAAGLFDVTMRSSEDRDMWIRVAMKSRVQLLPGNMVRVCRHTSNMSSHADRMKQNMRITLAKAYHSGVASRWNLFFWLKVLSVYRYQTALIYIGRSRLGAALRDISASLLFWPLCLSARQINSTVPFIRLRTLARICRQGLRPSGSQ